MPKYIVNDHVHQVKVGPGKFIKPGGSIELTEAEKEEMDPTGHYLTLEAAYLKRQVAKKAAKEADELEAGKGDAGGDNKGKAGKGDAGGDNKGKA